MDANDDKPRNRNRNRNRDRSDRDSRRSTRRGDGSRRGRARRGSRDDKGELSLSRSSRWARILWYPLTLIFPPRAAMCLLILPLQTSGTNAEMDPAPAAAVPADVLAGAPRAAISVVTSRRRISSTSSTRPADSPICLRTRTSTSTLSRWLKSKSDEMGFGPEPCEGELGLPLEWGVEGGRLQSSRVHSS